eukprot:TRINITY_DN1823_c0_g1_i2.p2 TRINITY_DN1823_c0_g1~~TRINITY_DN1823_c0_g1_i2.p2  ORF type:complete len:206 (-),score=51.69 TRINITY_DN1823_c0_g1_i2:50-667(-)
MDDSHAFYTPNAPIGMEPLEVEVQAPSHPFVVAFHLLFKILALTIYLFGLFVMEGRVSSPFVITFIISAIFLALDFWVTKNVSGRLLVGLRWWNDIKEDGSNVWVFESLEKEAIINPIESKIFWVALIVFPIVWFSFFLKQLFSFTGWDWAILCALSCTLQLANVTGYIKCAKEARKQMQDSLTSFVFSQALSAMTNQNSATTTV